MVANFFKKLLQNKKWLWVKVIFSQHYFFNSRLLEQKMKLRLKKKRKKKRFKISQGPKDSRVRNNFPAQTKENLEFNPCTNHSVLRVRHDIEQMNFIFKTLQRE